MDRVEVVDLPVAFENFDDAIELTACSGHRRTSLIAGVNFLDELSPRLRRSVLLIKDKVPKGTTVQDAETLAAYAGLMRSTNAFNDFTQAVTA